MADGRMIAHLAEIPAFLELKRHFDERREEELEVLARKTFANPEGHDQAEWERLRAFYRGVDAVFTTPENVRTNLRKEHE